MIYFYMHRYIFDSLKGLTDVHLKATITDFKDKFDKQVTKDNC